MADGNRSSLQFRSLRESQPFNIHLASVAFVAQLFCDAAVKRNSKDRF